ncbi:MAG: polysaccharide biosynthesis/export family protein [Caulobacteraceae bacterium]
MMRRIFGSVRFGALGVRLAAAGAVLVISGLGLAGAQTPPVGGSPVGAPPAIPPPTWPSYPTTPTMPAQSAPAPAPPVPSTYTTTPGTAPSTSTTTAPTSAQAVAATAQAGAGSQAAPLIGANPATPAATSLLQYQSAGIRPAPFGSELFGSANLTATTVGVVDPTYIMKPGDQISLALWGSVPDTNSIAVVDTNGNIVVPGVGPVSVSGQPAGRVDAIVKAAAAAVYRSAVHVYAAPVTTVPITVFMTGPVVAPGPYAGLGSDSVVAFLQRAGGIDPNRGSYRNVIVRRNGETIAHVDLYAFLRTGELPKVALHNNDVIVVGQQGPVVSVGGAARAPYTFELAGPSGTGEELLYYARPRPEANYVALLGYRNAQPLNAYISVRDFARQMLLDGDRVGFSADATADTVLVQVTGAFHGPASYVVPKTTSLGAVLARIQYDSMADRRWVYLQRVSAAFTQKQLLSEALARLQKAVYTRPALTANLVSANAAQAAVIQQYINFASLIQPIGIVSFPPGADLTRVSLEPNDIVVVPYKSQVVSIAGEVTEPQTLIWQQGKTIKDYVARAGGFGQIADKKHILIIHPDATTDVNTIPGPGDRILVTVHLPSQFLDIAATLTQILYQTAIAAKAAGA